MSISLRLEAHLILWVTALGVVGVAIFDSGMSGAEVSSDSLEPGAPLVEHISVARVGQSDTDSRNLLRKLPPIGEEERALFYIERPPEQAALPVAPPQAVAVPILKGIISSGHSLQAVFVVDPSSTAYVVASIGDPIGTFVVSAIEPEKVVVRDGSGASTVLSLRGTGEAP